MTFSRWRKLGMVFLLLTFWAVCLLSCGDDHDDDDDEEQEEEQESPTDENGLINPPVVNSSPPWPEWVLRHWVWEDESTQESAVSLVADYLARDIPVGAIIIDSPWETGYNTFAFDPKLYPDPQQMIDLLHSLGAKVFLWITPAVNIDSPNYQDGLNNGYYINNGRTLEWWKGRGSFIDFSNPDALAWWHAMMDTVLDMGIDGWKTDNPEFSLWRWVVLHTYAGVMSPKQYQELYYSDFFHYTRQRLGDSRVITARPVDTGGFPLWGPTYAPRDVNFAGWVGDQDPTWEGLNDALVNLIKSAEAGYVNFGSDIGGYRGGGVRDKELFIRWTQLGAFCPIMENGGAGEHRPWMIDEQTLTIYRDYVNLHHRLLPYLYSQGAESYAKGVSLMRPVSESGKSYMLGNGLFVAPIQKSGETRQVAFPAGSWIGLLDGETYEGPAMLTVQCPLDHYPAFVKKGAILPMDYGDGFATRGAPGNRSALTVVVYPDDAGSAEFDVYEQDGPGARIRATYGKALTLDLSATDRTYVFLIRGATLPNTVMVEPTGAPAWAENLETLRWMDSGWTYAEKDQGVWIKPGSAKKGLRLILR